MLTHDLAQKFENFEWVFFSSRKLTHAVWWCSRYTVEKEACKTTQMPFYHSRKISISPKGLTHDFSQKKFEFPSNLLFFENYLDDVWGCSR